MKKESAIVVGAGIVGLAIARALAVRGHKVTVIERSERAVGASIQNFGSLWLAGAANELYERAKVGRSIWLDILPKIGTWHEQYGSLHLAYESDEQAVLETYEEHHRGQRPYRMLTPAQVAEISPAAITGGLRCGLFSEDEVVLDSRDAIRKIPAYFSETLGVEFKFGMAVTAVEQGAVHCGSRKFEADRVYVCGGAEYDRLFPEVFEQAPITRCKLQMLRIAPEQANFKLGPALAAGLSLIHYPGFRVSPEVATLEKRFGEQFADLVELGIHVLVMQNGRGEITIGDSHVYGHTLDPFDEHVVNEKILGYMNTFLRLPPTRPVQSWHGIYPKLTDGGTELIREVLPGVTLVNGLGSLGMTLSFGLAEELIDGRYVAPSKPAAH